MIGYEIIFKNENDHAVDCDGPIFGSNVLLGLDLLADAKSFLSEGGTVEVCKNEYLGTEDDYDFNCPIWKRSFQTVKGLEEFIRNENIN